MPGEEHGPRLRCPASEGIIKLVHRVGEEIDADPDTGEVSEIRGDTLKERTLVVCKDDHDIKIAPGNGPSFGKRSKEDDTEDVRVICQSLHHRSQPFADQIRIKPEDRHRTE